MRASWAYGVSQEIQRGGRRWNVGAAGDAVQSGCKRVVQQKAGTRADELVDRLRGGICEALGVSQNYLQQQCDQYCWRAGTLRTTVPVGVERVWSGLLSRDSARSRLTVPRYTAGDGSEYRTR